MKKITLQLICCTIALNFFSCTTSMKESKEPETTSWQQQLDAQLPLNGHRNWILVVDKAFPQQPGMQIINTGEKLLPVLQVVLDRIEKSTHVRPVIFNDAELQFLTDSLAPGVSAYKEALKKILNGNTLQSLLHDSVFVQMSAAMKLFSITVLKTEETIPYSSVFIQLDCAYWGKEKEQQLRKLMSSPN